MKIQNFSIFSVIFSFGVVTAATATTFPSATTPFSQYGQIQNVQNYSSNPFWNPDSPYNQRMPVPVYIQGTDISSSDCQAVVAALVSAYCASRNNCVGVNVDDARPTLTIQLASLPSHNYVTPCSGYIDTEFEKYVSQNAVAAPSGTAVSFPGATYPNQNINSKTTEFQNPYSMENQLPTWNGETWMQDMIERQQELENLQSSSGITGNSRLASAEFPKTAADLTFTQRIQNETAGYEPYKDASAYIPLNIKTEEIYLSETQTTTGYISSEDLCKKAETQLIAMQSDLDKIQNCKTQKKKYTDCLKDLQFNYSAYNVSSTNSDNGTSYTNSLLNTSYTDKNSETYTYSSQSTYSNTSFGNKLLMWSNPITWATLLFSESDCIPDPTDNSKKVCCNTQKEKADRKVNVGGYMFCGKEIRDASGTIIRIDPVPGMVRQCLQNKRKRNTQTARGFAAMFLQDFWDQQCIQRLCEGEEPPQVAENNLNWFPDETNICWTWNCKEGTKSGNTCIRSSAPTEPDVSSQYDLMIQELEQSINKIKAECPNIQA